MQTGSFSFWQVFVIFAYNVCSCTGKYRFILHISDSFNPAQQLVSEWVSGQLHNINDHSTEDAIWSDEENINGNNNYEPSIRNIIAQQDAGALSMEGMRYM